ncbi:MAG: hypothetical protein JXR66_05405 [Bacteroidales bacterium]|nr:hypothetical protein [Bacteroidales bacterium]
MIWLVCSARTCNEDEDAVAAREEKQVKELIENIEMTFTNETPADSSLRAYEATAIDKLYDFADYLRIASDTSVDLKFRQHAAEMVRTLFIHGETEIEIKGRYTSGKELNTLDLLIDYSLSEGISYHINPVGITVNDRFVRENDSTFAGSLSFSIKYVSPSVSDQIEDLSGLYIMDIFLLRKIKHFGPQQLGVWEVFLGAAEIL